MNLPQLLHAVGANPALVILIWIFTLALLWLGWFARHLWDTYNGLAYVTGISFVLINGVGALFIMMQMIYILLTQA